MAESKESYQIRAESVPGLLQSLNFHMARVADRLDALEGHRDRPVFYQNPKLNAGQASRMVKTDADKIVQAQYQASAPASVSQTNDVAGSDTVDVSALNAILNSFALILNELVTGLQGANILDSSAEPSSEYDVTFQGDAVTFDGEDVAW